MERRVTTDPKVDAIHLQRSFKVTAAELSNS
jgi:hypothetical protein